MKSAVGPEPHDVLFLAEQESVKGRADSSPAADASGVRQMFRH